MASGKEGTMILRRLWLSLLTSASLFVGVFAHAGLLHDAVQAMSLLELRRPAKWLKIRRFPMGA